MPRLVVAILLIVLKLREHRLEAVLRFLLLLRILGLPLLLLGVLGHLLLEPFERRLRLLLALLGLLIARLLLLRLREILLGLLVVLHRLLIVFLLLRLFALLH